MKIYIASSWKNATAVEYIGSFLREAGHQCFLFCEEGVGHFVFDYRELPNFQDLDQLSFLREEKAKKAFKSDKDGIDWSDCVLLLLPSGKSAHLEAGYAKGKGKHLVILGEFLPGEFDVMYGFADALVRLDMKENWESSLIDTFSSMPDGKE